VSHSGPSKVSSAANSTGKGSDTHSLHTELTDILESERPEFLAHKLQQALAVVLQFPAGQMPERTRGFFDMGMDSISSVDFRLSLEDLVAKTLPPSIVFDYPTIDTLTTHLLTKIFAQEHPKTVERSSVSDDRPLIKTTKQTKSSSASTTKIEELSDEELAMLIDQELNSLNQMDTPR
jgi:acyl carrier protein